MRRLFCLVAQPPKPRPRPITVAAILGRVTGERRTSGSILKIAFFVNALSMIMSGLRDAKQQIAERFRRREALIFRGFMAIIPFTTLLDYSYKILI